MRASSRRSQGARLRAGALSAVLAGVAALATSCGGGAAKSACDLPIRDRAEGERLLADPSVRHFTAEFYSRLSNIYVLELALGRDVRRSPGRVLPARAAAIRVSNRSGHDVPLGNEGCSGPLVVRVFYPLPSAAREALPPRRVTRSGPGGVELFWVEYRFANTSAGKRLAPGGSTVLPQTGAPGAVPAAGPAVARALARSLSGSPTAVFAAGGDLQGRFALDGAAVCILRGTGGGALRLIAGWDGGGSPFDLTGDGCIYAGEAVFGVGDQWMPTG